MTLYFENDNILSRLRKKTTSCRIVFYKLLQNHFSVFLNFKTNFLNLHFSLHTNASVRWNMTISALIVM